MTYESRRAITMIEGNEGLQPRCRRLESRISLYSPCPTHSGYERSQSLQYPIFLNRQNQPRSIVASGSPSFFLMVLALDPPLLNRHSFASDLRRSASKFGRVRRCPTYFGVQQGCSKTKKGFRCCPESLIISGTPGKDRTCDLRIRNPSLYPLSYGGTDSSAQPNWTAKNLRLPSRGKSTPFLYCDHRRMDEDCV
jgi:hypothetical protein